MRDLGHIEPWSPKAGRGVRIPCVSGGGFGCETLWGLAAVQDQGAGEDLGEEDVFVPGDGARLDLGRRLEKKGQFFVALTGNVTWLRT